MPYNPQTGKYEYNTLADRAAAGDIFAFGGNQVNLGSGGGIDTNNPTTPVAAPYQSVATSTESRDQKNQIVQDLTQYGAGQQFNYGGSTYKVIEPSTATTRGKIEPVPGKKEETLGTLSPGDEEPSITPTSGIAYTPEEQERLKQNKQLGDYLQKGMEELMRYTDPYADPQFATSLSIFNRQFNDLRQETEQYNSRVEALQEKMGITSGTQRYSPFVAGGEVLQRVKEGLTRIQSIEDKRREAIAGAYQSMKSKRWDTMAKQYSLYKDLGDQLDSEIKNRIAMMKEERESLAQADKDVLDAGYRQAQIDQMNSGVMQDSLNYLQDQATGYAAQLETEGLITGTDAEADRAAIEKFAQENNFPPSLLYEALQKSKSYTYTTLPNGQTAQIDKQGRIVKVLSTPSGSGGVMNNITPSFGEEYQGKAGEILSAVKNLRFGTVEESKRIIGNIQSRLNQGDIEGAESELKLFGYQKLKGTQLSDYDLYEGGTAAFGQALSELNDSSLATGPYKTLFEKAKPWLAIKQDQAFLSLKQTIELGQAQIRKAYYGTAVTDREGFNADKFLINDNDQIDSIKTKLQNSIQFLKWTNDNTIAKSVNLPKPDLSDYMNDIAPDSQYPIGSTREEDGYLWMLGDDGLWEAIANIAPK